MMLFPCRKPQNYFFVCVSQLGIDLASGLWPCPGVVTNLDLFRPQPQVRMQLLARSSVLSKHTWLLVPEALILNDLSDN